MTIFKDHSVTAAELLNLIPESLFSHLSQTSKVDYYAKVLHGKKMFYLLLYGILENDRLSQRTLEDTFNDSVFKVLFNLDPDEKVRRSSISERLSKIDPNYFSQIYETIYKQLSKLYSKTEMQKYHIVPVDSTMITDVTGKFVDGLRGSSSKKHVKYSMTFDGLLPSQSKVFTENTYCSEDMALPKVIYDNVKKETGHRNIYIIDRGLQSAKNMQTFSNDNIEFIVRFREGRRYKELESFITDETIFDLGTLTLIKDCKVNLRTHHKTLNAETGKVDRRKELLKEPFRLIITKSKEDENLEYWFVTNCFDLSAKEVTDAYKKRWNIEVFFRFIKQELNVSHLVSLNKNGIEVMLYMTLIAAMLVLIYKQENKLSYKTAKRRFAMEIRNLAITMIVEICGGEASKFFKSDKSP